MMVSEQTKVTISYTFSTTDGTFLGSSEKSGLFSFVPGRGDAVSGLETRILGAELGSAFKHEIPAEEAYGAWNPDREFRLDPKTLEGLGDIQPGMRVTTTLDGDQVDLVVTEVNDLEVVLDGNHPLAGHDIVFEGKIEAIDEAEEVAGGCGCGSSCGCGSH